MALDPSALRERKLEAVWGYLQLEMFARALRELDEIADSDEIPFEFYYLKGEALRGLNRFEAALDTYTRAQSQRPEDLATSLAMAWCYKRCNQLERAIESMEETYRRYPKEPIVLYNIACYYCLAGNKPQTLSWLGRTLRMDGSLRSRVPEESDFDSLREDPDFQYVAEPGRSLDL